MPFIVLAFLAVLGGTAAEAQEGASQSLTLDQALRFAESAHPALQSARYSAEAAGARVGDAGRRPNPALSLSVENLGTGRGAGAVESTLELAQPIEFGGDRAARTGVARARLEAAHAEVEASRRGVHAETVERFLDAWVVQERIVRLAAAESAATEAESAAAARLRAGAAPAFEQIRARGFRALRAAERRHAEADLAVARRGLALQWGGDSLAFQSLALDAPSGASIPETARLIDLVADHPERRSAEAELATETWRAREARATRVPDLALTAGVRRLGESETGFVAGISLPLPAWNSMRGSIAAAESERSAAESRARATAQRLHERVRAARDRYASAVALWERLRTDVHPDAAQALDLIVAGYRAGRLTYLDIQDGQRGLTEVELMLIDATAEAWRAKAGLERLIGRSMDDVDDGRNGR